MSAPAPARVVGLAPWLPWPLSRWRWWTEPIRAERLAALRIGVGIVLLIDVLFIYLPQAGDLYGQGSLGDPSAFAYWRAAPHWNWSLLDGVHSQVAMGYWMLAWAAAALGLILGVLPRLSAAVAWALSMSFFNLNVYIHHGGDTIRTILLFYLMLCPCGACWSVAAWWRRGSAQPEPRYVHPWPVCLLFVQLVLIYFFNGVFKLAGEDWRNGSALHYVLADPSGARWWIPGLMPLPAWLTTGLTWFVMGWEILFPLLVLPPRVRPWALGVGAVFHLGIGWSMELAVFPLYMLCLYLPLVPWERFGPKEAESAASLG